MRNQTYKSPSHNSVITHVHTSIYGCLGPIYSMGCPRKIQIWKSGGSGRLMRMNIVTVMWNEGWWNKMEFELYEAGCFLKVGVIKERWMTTATRVLKRT